MRLSVVAFTVAMTSAAIVVTRDFAAAEPRSFDAHPAYPVGANPKGLSAGDCDGDGIDDVVVAAQGSNEVTILRNVGDGRLEFGGGRTNVSQPTGAACADLDGDGRIDLAVASRLGGVTLYLQNANGEYVASGTRPVGTAPASLVGGDLNGDGRIDVVAVDAMSQDVSILLNTGTGTLPPVLRVRAPIADPQAAAIADFDADGHADIAVVGATAPWVAVLFGSDVGFAARNTAIPVPFVPVALRPTHGRGIAAGDLDDDGIPDLAVLSSDGVLKIFAGNGLGQFAFLDAFNVAPEAQAIALSDLDGDGRRDLALTASDTNSVQIFAGTESDIFELRAATHVSVARNGFGALASRTIGGDTAGPPPTTQLVAADAAAKALTVVEQRVPTALTLATVTPVPDVPRSVVLGDLDGDGIEDAVVLAIAPRGRELTLHAMLGSGDGAYAAVSRGGSGTCGNGIVDAGEQCDDGNLKRKDGCSNACAVELGTAVSSLDLADLDGDGRADVVFSDGRGTVRVAYSDGTGRFRRVTTLGAGRRKTPAAVADFTGDGAVDVLLVSKRALAGALALAVNAGDGTFRTQPVTAERGIRGPMLAADFDRDGLADVAIGLRNGWAALYNAGGGSFALVPTVLGKPFKNLSRLAAADLDEDGWLDVVAAFASPKVPTVMFRGSAAGTFATAEVVDVGAPIPEPFVADLDGDDHQDIVTCATATALSCRAYYGDGTGSFGPASLPSPSAVGREPRAAAAADFDADGYADVVGISHADDRAVVSFGGEDGWNGRMLLAVGSRPSDVEALDLNGDGRQDFVVANEGSRDLSIFVNQGERQFVALAPVRLPTVPNSGLGLIALAAGDIDGDGAIDLVAVQAGGQAGGTVTPLINVAGVGLAAVGSLPVGELAWGIALGHLNADARLDIVTANRDDDTFTVLLSQPDGSYVRADHASGGIRATDVAVADVNQDGFDDVLVTNERVDDKTDDYGNVVTFENDGQGSFGAPAIRHVRGRETPRAICSADFDADGVPDAAVASLESNDIMVLFGVLGGGWRSDEKLFPVGDAPLSVRCADADGDGRSDIAFGRRSGSEVGVILTGN